ncbi:MAG: hypothetical protein DWI21_04450 [Planctomycetota bacterium]|nr:MAG: hypothetical protein DWI21_04450 [Planctomycetota bacterium]GDY10773.1 hypothetical protein LBMAG52_42610 [Planctomycetia bacterium]
MPIRELWKRVATTWKQFRPARRRRSSARFFAEAFEPRRMLSAFFVNSLADSHDAIPGDGIATDANGFTTLRAALEEANVRIGADTITLPAGVITLSATNGSLTVIDDVTILGNGASVIDGDAINDVFSVHGAAHLQLNQVSVFSSGTLAASLRPTLLTTNARQADLVVAFSASPSTPFAVDTKTSSGLSSLIGVTTPEIIFNELTEPPTTKETALGDFAVPTPDQAIDQIINALFRNEPGFVLPVGAEQIPGAISDEDVRPMPKSKSVEKSSLPETPPNFESDSPPESMSSDEDGTSENSSNDEAVGEILRGWADEAGFGGLDVLTRGSQTITARPRQANRVAVLAGALLSGAVAKSWSRAERDSWHESLSLTAWRTRFERLRRRAR